MRSVFSFVATLLGVASAIPSLHSERVVHEIRVFGYPLDQD